MLVHLSTKTVEWVQSLAETGFNFPTIEGEGLNLLFQLEDGEEARQGKTKRDNLE